MWTILWENPLPVILLRELLLPRHIQWTLTAKSSRHN